MQNRNPDFDPALLVIESNDIQAMKRALIFFARSSVSGIFGFQGMPARFASRDLDDLTGIRGRRTVANEIDL